MKLSLIHFLATGFIASNIGTSYEHSDTVPTGAIISQTPESGEVVAEDNVHQF